MILLGERRENSSFPMMKEVRGVGKGIFNNNGRNEEIFAFRARESFAFCDTHYDSVCSSLTPNG